ncbi:5'-methylthioadenosine/S-adenosylhomocysteine nucleosidase [Actinoplanes rectilineatus]|uniref:5'-methylthioadenosine/S-adenosylhomocysteine nucleosidase family protein n=1 Tax=Actinoplanes rectilineatus TaxID=113571 RepID=UPI0005F2EF2A|nr:5'-methylthioadenosine/S-adenosylhomocysteine nucleosidase [Actinoplanes rectilineatus]
MTADPIVVLTALNVEYEAARRLVRTPRVHWHPAGTRFETGTVGERGCKVALGLVGKGNHPAAVIAERAITEFSPTAVIFTGVAGSLWPGVELGDVVVASQVYAYHGGTAEDDGLKARPKAWEISHQAGQIAQHLIRTGQWSQAPRPTVHFAPIAAGEVVQDSRISDHARWVREHYNDALAIEMEAAGVTQAGHLNHALPIVVVRGISDRADGSKSTTDGESWQPRAARHAAAFAMAMAEELATELGPRHRSKTGGHRMEPTATFRNIATGNARVGTQIGQLNGNLSTGDVPSGPTELAKAVAALYNDLTDAHRNGLLDDTSYAAAVEELTAAGDDLDDLPGTRDRVLVAFKKLSGLVGDTADLAAGVSAVIAMVGSLS